MKDIAHQIRTEYVKDHHPDWSHDPDRQDLCGDCARATLRLFYALRELGHLPTLQAASDHVWLTVGATFIDITATQFGKKFPPVHIGEGKPDYSHKGFHSTLFTTQDPQEFVEWLLSHNWPQEQVI